MAKNSSTITTLGEGLNNLNSIDKNKTAEIYEKLDSDSLIQMAKNSSTLYILGNGLNNLNSIDKKKTVEIYENLDIDIYIEEFKQSIKNNKLNLFNFNHLSTIIILRNRKDEITLLKYFYNAFKEKRFYCIGCNSLKVIANTIKNLKEINISVIKDIDSKIYNFIARSLKNHEHDISYFFSGLYSLYGKKDINQFINRYIHQNRFLNDTDKKTILSKVYMAISYKMFLATDILWIEFMKKAYGNITDDENRAYIHFLFAKNYLSFNDAKYTDDDFRQAKENYEKSLSLATEEQKKSFIHELGSFF
jgi:hypothetical protein